MEGLCRGFKCGILKQSDYLNLVQCETLEGKLRAAVESSCLRNSSRPSHVIRLLSSYGCSFIVFLPSPSHLPADLKLHLQGTDYGQFLANEPSPLSVSTIDDKLREKLVIEFQHLRNHAVEPLSTFLDFITYSYMIDNIILLITGTLHQRPINELIPKCHPLGSFEQMEAIHVAATPAELYNAVLVDTPLAPFFVDCISEQDLDEMNIEIIRNTLYKAYLEAFYEFCKKIGGTTADVMCEILAVSARVTHNRPIIY